MKIRRMLFLILSLFFLAISQNSYAQYVTNYAFNFNGTSSHVAIPDNAELNPTSAITIEAWINPRNLGCVTFVGKRYTSNYWFGSCNNGKLRFYPKGGIGQFVDGNASLQLNKWSHVAASYDGTTTKLYINGQLDISSNSISGPIIPNVDSLCIGGDVTGYFYNGYIDNVRLWNVARTQQQIQNNMYVPLQVRRPTGNYSGLVGAWLFDWDASDFSGAVSNNGILIDIGFVYLNNKPINHCDFNNALSLDGNSYVAAPAENDFNATSAITIEAWIKRDLSLPQPPAQNIIHKGNSGGFDYALFLVSTNNQLWFETNTGSGIIIDQFNVITDEAWHHIAATYNSIDGKAILYVDGNIVKQSTFDTKPQINNTADDSLFIGAPHPATGPDAYNKFKGQIDEVRIWKNVARTETQIKETMFESRKDTDGASESCSFSFDENTNMMHANASGISNGFAFRGNASITSSKLQNNYSSPIISTVGTNKLTNFIMSTNRPLLTTGTAVDSVYFPGTGGLAVSEVKVAVLLNHGSIGSVGLSLISPDGIEVNLTPTYNYSNTSHDLITIFDANADSSINYTNYGLPPFSPKVKPYSYDFNAFWSSTAIGWWKLKITDNSIGNMLRVLNGWGIQLETYVVPQYTIITSSNVQNWGTTGGGGVYNYGRSVTVTATPNSGYSFVNWTENGTVVSTNSNYTFSASANRNLVANFSLIQFTITTSSNPPAGGTTSGGGTFNSGQSVTVMSTPNTGYSFTNWTEDAAVVSSDPNYTFSVTANRNLVANFSLMQFTITTSSNPPAGGTTSGGGIFNSGQSVTVTATPNNGYSFVNWTENGIVVSTDQNYTFSITANRNLVANFSLIQFTITTSSNPSGGGATSGGGTFNSGQSVTVTATPNTGYSFTNWTENGTAVSTEVNYTFSITVNRNLVANFSVIQCTLTTSSNPPAGGTTSGGGIFNYGHNITVTAVPNTGYRFSNWTEAAAIVSTNPSYSFTLTENRSLTANFIIIPVLAVSPDFRVVPSNVGTTTFEVSNTAGWIMNWSASSNVGWATIISGSSGTNSGTISVHYQANTGAERTAVINIIAEGAIGSPKTVEVRQSQFTDVQDGEMGIPTNYVLFQNFPNPFNPATKIRYGLPQDCFVKLTVYNIIGKEIAVLVKETQSAGYHEVTFDTQTVTGGLPASIYFYEVSAGEFLQIKKMMFLK